MDSTLTAGIIGGIATVFAAFLGQSGVFEVLLQGKKYRKLPTEWESTWVDIDDPTQTEHRERFYISKQKCGKISGYILYDTAPDKRWEFEGNFTGRFLQLFYYPSEKADDTLFQDYGCYFFQLDGTEFVGYSVGYDYEEGLIASSKHKLIRINKK
jgi:hypothetical protein